jgi:hypothetical protein
MLPSPSTFHLKRKDHGLLDARVCCAAISQHMDNQEQSAEEIFGAALDLPEEQRSSYVSQACGASSQLHETVNRLFA